MFARGAASRRCPGKARGLAGFESKRLHGNQENQSPVVAQGGTRRPRRADGPVPAAGALPQPRRKPQLTCSPRLRATRAAPSSASASLMGRMRRATCTHSTHTHGARVCRGHRASTPECSALCEHQRYLQLLAAPLLLINLKTLS